MSLTGHRPRPTTLRELVASRAYATNKLPKYLEVYERYFAPLRDRDITLLEIGVDRGGSLELWRDYLGGGTVVGLDVRDVPAADGVHVYKGSQDDVALLDRIAAERAPDGFDVVIDDGSHLARHAEASFWHLFDRHLRPRGIYALEDWGTGYWREWPDGHVWSPLRRTRRTRTRWRSHDYGMVGFVKQLIDEVAFGDVSHPKRGGPGPPRSSRFDHMHVIQGLAVVAKAA